MTEREAVVPLSVAVTTKRKHFCSLSGLQFVSLKYFEILFGTILLVKVKIERSIISCDKIKQNRIRMFRVIQKFC